jgi:DNA-binding winged helix-turn-helix (wHTH) protein/tetratricopeptide (TPR) repeat protein
MLYRFANFELDRQRAELRGPGGDPVKLRRKAFDMLTLFVANAGRVVSKEELSEAIWPNVHVGEDSLFQCIREVRAALGDDQRRMIRVVPGRGYLFDAAVSASASTERAEPGVPAPAPPAAAVPARRAWFRRRGPAVPGALAGFAAIVGLAVAAPMLAPDLLFKRARPVLAVLPTTAAAGDPQAAAMAAAVTANLTDGLAKIDNIRVIAPEAAGSSDAHIASARYLVRSELQKLDDKWRMDARIVDTATDEVRPVAAVTVAAGHIAPPMQRSRLAAGIGYQLALRLNAALYSPPRPAQRPGGNAAIEQAIASINRTTRERFADAQVMLEKALAADPRNSDVAVALAALKMRGIQLAWYSPADSEAAEASARAILERALRARPNSLPALQANCRFLVATNQFIDGLVACARTVALNPWDGMALYHIGLAQIQLARFDDALDTFERADRYDTPQVSRWTWLLGAGIAALMMDRPQEAVNWLERSIAITPASGRPYMVLSAALARLGRMEDARAAMAKGMALRPGSTAANVHLPFKNTSPVYRAALERIEAANLEAGLPAR